MALPSSGQITFNNVRTEMSQSIKTNYEFSAWAWGNNSYGWSAGTYAPINVLSSGSRFTEANPLSYQNFSMSAWYNYNHTLSLPTNVTGTLYQHADATQYCYPSTMLIVDVGVSNTEYTINISGSTSYGEVIEVYYGKPWSNSGAAGTGSAVFITSSFGNMSFNYAYSYNSSLGQYLYFVMLGACP